jgi:hypothetical protein
VKGRPNFIQKVTQFLQGNKVQDASASNIDGVLPGGTVILPFT